MRRNRIIFLAILGVALAIVAVSLLITQGTSRVTGLVGSEKAPFFEDERVQKALRRHGLEVTVQKAGSREIATSFDLSQYDFAFPAGLFVQQGIARDEGGYYTIDMNALLPLLQAQARWKDLPNNTAFAANKSVWSSSPSPTRQR